RVTQQISGLASDLGNETKALKSSMIEPNRRMAMLNCERAWEHCEQGDLGQGLLWYVASWRAAVAAKNLEWQRTARAGLFAWQREYSHLNLILAHEGAAAC